MAAERTRYTTNAPRIIHETIDDDTVVIDTETGIYYSITGCGYLFLPVLDHGADADSLMAGLSAAYRMDPDDLRPVVDDFLARLLAESLIVPVPAEPVTESTAADTTLPFPANLASYAPPAMEKFTDMHELLLMDPIHEVSDAGWPHRA